MHTGPDLIDGRRDAPSYQAQIRELLLDDTSFAEIEDAIDRLPIPEDHRSALWLWAWLHRQPAGECMADPMGVRAPAA